MRLLLLLAVVASTVVPGCSCGSVHLPSDAGLVDAALPPAPDVDPLGTWLACATTCSFEADGTTQRLDHMQGCASSGTWSADGGVIFVVWDTTCPGMGTENAFDATRASVGLVLVDRASGSLQMMAPETALVRTYTLVDDADPTLRSVVRLIGEPGRPGGSGCYWSEDRMCGGVLSCSGGVAQWPLGDEVIASTTCGGDCPCGAILHVMPGTGEALAIRYDAVYCGGSRMGTATATPRAE